MSTEQQPIVSVPQSIISDEVVDPPEKPVLKDPPVEEDSKTNGDETETNISDDEVSAEGGGEPTPVEEEVAKEETPKSSQPGPYVYDPNKITLKFIFANRDGVKVILECKPEDTVGEVKGALLSMWPESVPETSGGDKIRLICMGKGMLSPDSKTLKSLDVPIFKTHPTPINVAVRPENIEVYGKKGTSDRKKKNSTSTSGGGGGNSGANNTSGRSSGREPGSSGCSCSIM